MQGLEGRKIEGGQATKTWKQGGTYRKVIILAGPSKNAPTDFVPVNFVAPKKSDKQKILPKMVEFDDILPILYSVIFENY